MGSAARPWHRPDDPRPFLGCPAGGDRVVVSGAAPSGKARVAQVGVEADRVEPTREVLPADSAGQEAAFSCPQSLDPAGDCHRPRDAPGDGKGVAMSFWRWAG